jgi:hypothetical protein
MICECQGSQWKGGDSTNRDIEKWFSGMIPKALRMMAKVCIKGNRCKITYFCVMNQFWEFLKPPFTVSVESSGCEH